MKKSVLIFATIAVSLVISVSYAADNNKDLIISPERRLALVIGNAAYRNLSPLRNTINDANDMEKTLRNMKFEVIVRVNPGLKEMEDAIREFGEKLRKSDVGLFYYSGHGVQANGENYLIPTDAEIRRESDLKYAAVHAGKVLDEMTDAGNRLNIVILDACRNNPFNRSFKSVRQGLAQMNAPEDRQMLIAYATAPNSVASDNPSGRNSIYTENLLKHMTVPGLPIEKMFKEVRKGVFQDSGNKQMPWEHSSLMGDFYFVADSGSATIVTPKPPQPVKPAEPEKPKEAVLNVTADVSGAEVWLDGKKYGQTPRRFTLPEPGKYEIEVTASGYKKYRTSKNIDLAKEYDVSVHLEKEPEPAPVAKPSVSQKPKPEPVSDTARKAKYNLRSEPITTDNREKDFKLDGNWRPLEYIENDFKDNGDGTITDYATGLMWQKSGSPDEKYLKDVPAYIEKLNREKFAGYSDWRLPTIDELKSLITENKQSNGLYINPIFDKEQRWCWSSDNHASGGAWFVNFNLGYVHWDLVNNYARAVRSGQ